MQRKYLDLKNNGLIHYTLAFNAQPILNVVHVYAKYMKHEYYWHMFYVITIKWT